MSTLAPILQTFFTDRLQRQRQASTHTIAAYRDAIRLLVVYAADQAAKAPSAMDIADLDAPLIGAFLNHLEADRHNSVRTRNVRLAAVHSLFRHAALHRPDDAAIIQRVLAIPPKRFDRTLVTYLTEEEISALLAAPDRGTWTGRRDHAVLMLACQTGLRASELLHLTVSDVHLGTGAHVSCLGKGRKQRITPLTSATAATLRVWLVERAGLPTGPLFSTRRGAPLSHDGLQRRRLTIHCTTAAQTCPTLRGKQISPHVLRHSAAMRLLAAGVDTTVIALWLGHENVATTQIYIHADLALKEKALARTAPQDAEPGRYRASDAVLAFLDGL
jgi:site-specific recombinase XerD